MLSPCTRGKEQANVANLEHRLCELFVGKETKEVNAYYIMVNVLRPEQESMDSFCLETMAAGTPETLNFEEVEYLFRYWSACKVSN